MASDLSRPLSELDLRAAGQVHQPPGFVSEAESLSEDALKRWEIDQHAALNRRQAHLNQLDVTGQERKDSTQPRGDVQIPPKRLGNRRYTKFVPGADSWSNSESSHLLSLEDEDENLPAEDVQEDAAMFGLAEDIDAVLPGHWLGTIR